MGCEQLHEAVHGLMVFVTQYVIADRSDLLSLHAVGVVVGSNGILLPGSSGSGKTTLCARLLQHGAAYLSDDSSPLSPYGAARRLRPAARLQTGHLGTVAGGRPGGHRRPGGGSGSVGVARTTRPARCVHRNRG